MREYFGTRIATVHMLLDVARAARAAGATNVSNKQQAKVIGQVIISVLVLGAGIYFAGWHPSESLAKIAIGWIGLVVGYWIS